MEESEKPEERERYEQPPELDDEDERILDEIWDRIGKEESQEGPTDGD